MALIRRIYHYVRRRMKGAFADIYLRSVVLPKIRREGKLGGPVSVLDAHSGVVLTSPERVFKINFGRSTDVVREFCRYSSVLARWPDVAVVLPALNLRREFLHAYLEMPRYSAVSPEHAIEHALTLYAYMGRFREDVTLAQSRELTAELRAGGHLIEGLYGTSISATILDAVRKFIRSGPCHIGLAHGDFHSRNIVLGLDGNPRMVDLDCMRLSGIQELDAVYFVLELEWSRSGTHWLVSLASLLANEPAGPSYLELRKFGVEPSLALFAAYLLDRIGQETENFGYVFGRSMLDPVLALILPERMSRRDKGRTTGIWGPL